MLLWRADVKVANRKLYWGEIHARLVTAFAKNLFSLIKNASHTFFSLGPRNYEILRRAPTQFEAERIVRFWFIVLENLIVPIFPALGRLIAFFYWQRVGEEKGGWHKFLVHLQHFPSVATSSISRWHRDQTASIIDHVMGSQKAPLLPFSLPSGPAKRRTMCW